MTTIVDSIRKHQKLIVLGVFLAVTIILYILLSIKLQFAIHHRGGSEELRAEPLSMSKTLETELLAKNTHIPP